MVLNPGKCHYVVIRDDDPPHKIILNNNEIASSNEKKFKVSVLLDSKLNFESHITSIKISSKILIQLLPTDLDVYLSLFK